STLDQLRSRTANRRSRRASRQQSLGSAGGTSDANELEGVEGNNFATPPASSASSRRNNSRGSTGTPKTHDTFSRPSTSMSIESSTQGPDEGEFVTLKQATPLVETKLIEEKSGDLVEKYGTKLPPGPPPAKLRRANKKMTITTVTFMSKTLKKVETLRPKRKNPNSTTPEKQKSFTSPGSQKSINGHRKLLVCGKAENGRLGLHGNSSSHVLKPHPIRHFTGRVQKIAAGRDHTLALSSDGAIYAWGLGHDGRLGLGTEDNAPHPTKISFGPIADQVVTAIACGEMHCLAVTESRKVFSWGRNYYGRLGHGDSNNRSVPEMIRSLSHLSIYNVSAGVAYSVEIIDICSGYDHSLALDSVGEVYSWGNGGYGQLGQSAGNLCISTPEVVSGLSGQQCVSIAAGEFSSIAITAVGSIFSWGGGFGALGHEDVKNVYEPKLVDALKDFNVAACAVGSVHALVLVETDTAFDESEMEISYQEDDDEILQDFDEESSLEDDGMERKKSDGRNRGGDVSLESSVNSIDFDAPLLNNAGSSPVSGGGRVGDEQRSKAGKISKKSVTSPSPYRSHDGTSSLGHVEEDEWLDEGEGAISLRVNDAPKYAPQSPELYSRETLFKYGDTLARFGYQGFSGEENYRKKYALGNQLGGGNLEMQEEESPPTHRYPTKDDADGVGVRTPTTYMRSTPSTGRTIGSTTFFNNVSGGGGGGGGGGSLSTGGARAAPVGKGGVELARWLEKHDLGELYESLTGSGFGSLDSLSKNVEFTDGALEEMGVFKKGLRMQFLAALKKLRSFKLVANVVRGEGMKSGGWCGPTRRRISVKWMGGQKMTRVATGNKPMWSETLIFQSVDQGEAERGEVIMEVIQNGVAKSSCSVAFEEIDRVPSEAEMGDGKPYPLVSVKGDMVGCIWVKLLLRREGL
ncbi:hypothetical protein TrRE_jg11034, partial [Triparma retinervis]